MAQAPIAAVPSAHTHAYTYIQSGHVTDSPLAAARSRAPGVIGFSCGLRTGECAAQKIQVIRRYSSDEGSLSIGYISIFPEFSIRVLFFNQSNRKLFKKPN